MKDRLSRIGPVIRDDTVSRFQETLLPGNFNGKGQGVRDNRCMLWYGVLQRGQVLTWHDQDMRRRLRREITKRNVEVALSNQGRT